MLQYSEGNMNAAIEDAERGMPVATAAKKHKVPRSTLWNKIKGKTPRKRQMGRDSYLSSAHENTLVDWIKKVSKAGFPVSRDQLLDSVRKLVIELEIETPFKNNRPGKRWYKSFLKRHPDISSRVCQNLTSSRASVTKEKLDNWFDEILTFLKTEGHDQILNDPKRVFNADESAFFLNPKGSKVLAPKGDKCIYQQVNSDEKECLTVLITGNAAGDVVSPMVIFKYERIPKDICLSVPTTWGLGRSENGWMTGETFYEFVANVFNKWLLDNQIKKPVILFIDGHASHLTLNVSKFCSENGIILVALYPNATHLIQPMDVAVFRSLKGSWKDAVRQWRIDHIDSPMLRKVHFCPLLEKVINDTLNPSILKNGFRKCGIVPWNKDEVIPSLDNPRTTLIPQNKQAAVEEWKTGIAFIEKHIDAEKLRVFKSGSFELEDKSLYEFYQKIVALQPHQLKQNSQNILEVQDSNNTTSTKDKDVNNINQAVLNQLIMNTPSTSKASETTVYSDTVHNDHSTPSKSNVADENIPSPFKRALFWPEVKQKINKKRKIDKVPAVITSKEWIQYHEDKDKKKAKLIEDKAKRVEERKRKKEEKESLKNLKKKKNTKKKHKVVKSKNISSSSEECEEWIESGDSIEDILSETESMKSFLNTEDEVLLPEEILKENIMICDARGMKEENTKRNKGKGKGKAKDSKLASISKILQIKESSEMNVNHCDQCRANLHENKIKCMACQKWSCSLCADGYLFFDFICKKCLGDSQDI